MGKKNLGPFFIVIFIALIAGMIFLNNWIQGKVGEIVDNPINAPVVKLTPPEEMVVAAPKRRTGEVLKKTRLAPERTFERSIFYQGGEEIARHKVSKKGGIIYDHTGNIPNGKVKFINETNKTYGVEYYRDNVRHGPGRTKYKDGQLKNESEYQYGKLKTRKEYYIDGVLKMEEDYNDAREFMDNRETGIGKVYWRDGKVQFEWYMVNSDPVGYIKTYNTKGTLTSAVYFDEFGNEKPPKESVAVTDVALPTETIPQ